ncbi:hypothetical protein MA16_Dca024916 [Dendrobium catenatum]|uniref:Uncharacterized protein n=1 Tax=Dendrobium catenatum TaxID=906689 RepID=A0A2I0WDD7_9ASPA|nr:hypothetical protein MA16_Dca024916 [Dendrobium catenatum]
MVPSELKRRSTIMHIKLICQEIIKYLQLLMWWTLRPSMMKTSFLLRGNDTGASSIAFSFLLLLYYVLMFTCIAFDVSAFLPACINKCKGNKDRREVYQLFSFPVFIRVILAVS